jgi:hypothetical protein
VAGTDDEALLLMTGFLKKLETLQSTIAVRSTLHVVKYCSTINGIFISHFCLTGKSQEITSTLMKNGCYSIWNFSKSGRMTVRVAIVLIENGQNAS